MTVTHPSSKPLLRGHSHQAAFFFALGACAMLLASVRSSQVAVPTLVYALSLVTMFGISALYHRPQWGQAGRLWMKKLDHAAIFFLIAGTSTPVCLLAIGGDSGHKVLLVIWLTAIVGMLQSLFWTRAPKWLTVGLYIGCGWIASPYMREIGATMGFNSIVLLVIGGVVYTLGALIYALKKPNPLPKTFGYHEVFHLFVIVAATFHFVVVARLVN